MSTAARYVRVAALLGVGLMSVVPRAGAQELLRNPGFESIPGPLQGQGILPSEWVIVSVTPDTYSNDGSYGLRPQDFNNFVGLTAHSGLRFVGGWANGTLLERYGQVLSAPLEPGGHYRLTAWMMISTRPDLRGPGTYTMYLAPSVTGPRTLLGVMSPMLSEAGVWRPASLEFVAPPNAAANPMLVFEPAQGTGSGSYPALDDLSLTLVAACDPDVNQDGAADQGDVDYLIDVIGGGGNPTGIDPDFNRDGNVDQDDVDALLNVVAGGACP